MNLRTRHATSAVAAKARISKEVRLTEWASPVLLVSCHYLLSQLTIHNNKTNHRKQYWIAEHRKDSINSEAQYLWLLSWEEEGIGPRAMVSGIQHDGYVFVYRNNYLRLQLHRHIFHGQRDTDVTTCYLLVGAQVGSTEFSLPQELAYCGGGDTKENWHSYDGERIT